MLRAATLFLFVLSLGFPFALSAQETQPSPNGAVLILGAASFDQTFEIEVKTASGQVFSYKEIVSARNTCRLEGLPAGKVTVIGKIGGKKMKELALTLPAVGAEVGIERESYSTIVTLGVFAAIGAAGLAVESIEGNVNGIIESSLLLGAAGTFLVIGLIKGRDTLISNGKSVKKDGTIRADLSPLLLQPGKDSKKASLGLGIALRF
jgi:hypothetical protein